MYKRKVKPRIAIVPTPWAGLPLLDITRRLNQRSFALLGETWSDEARRSCSSVYALDHLWPKVDPRVCARVGRCPFLLMDLHFLNPDWWRLAGQSAGGPLQLNAPRAMFTEAQAAPLVREILIEAWRMAGSMPRAANLLFGMAPVVSRTIAEFSIERVDRIAAEQARYLRPRWEESRTFWAQLLKAAIGSEDDALTGVHLHALQLLGSETVSRHV
jgi:hypothetical protein